MMEGGSDWGVIVAISGQIVTWLGIIILFSIAWGKMVQRMTDVEEDVDEVKKEIHNPDHRLLTEDAHETLCWPRQEIINLRLEHICKKLDERKHIDDGLFLRLQNIEKAVIELTTKLQMNQEEGK